MTLASNPPIEIPLENLSIAQKWQVFDWLKKDLSVDETGPQEWHFELLAEREKRLASGEAQLMELDDFISAMRQTMP